MVTANGTDIRQEILNAIRDLPGWPASKIFEHITEKFDAKTELQRLILDHWQRLINTGVVAWGHDALNWQPPFFHLTEVGRKVMQGISRDPSNPEGYMANLATLTLPDTAESYIREALDTYGSSCFKATAVMVGVAAESLAKDLADAVADRLKALGKPVDRGLIDWRAKTVLDTLNATLTPALADAVKNRATGDQAIVKLRESFEYNWPSMTHMIRAARNDAGHPGSIGPVTPEDVHATLLTFPHVASIVKQLKSWVATAAL